MPRKLSLPIQIFYSLKRNNGVLTVSTNGYLGIINPLLGYKIFFLLQSYSLEQNDDVAYSGKLFYEDILKEYSGKQSTKIIERRNATFNKSSRKFFRDYIHASIDSTNYNIGISTLVGEGQFEYISDISRQNLLSNSANSTLFELNFNQFLLIENKTIHTGTTDSAKQSGFGSLSNAADLYKTIINKKDAKPNSGSYATSYMRSKTSKIILNQIGLIQNPGDIIEYGYWSELRLADRLPDNFSPSTIY